MSIPERLIRIARYAWAAPCTAVGLVLAVPMLLVGGSAKLHSGVIEVACSRTERKRRIPFGAITLGHVVLGRNDRVLVEYRAHEHEHVRQYERWGPVFFLAYPVSSIYQMLRGRNPYWYNHFEVQCRARCAMSRHDGAGDFDFFIGQWNVAHRRLKERLAGCGEWVEFAGSCETRKILGGLGNMDDNFLDLPGGAYRAITLRSYNAETGKWSIWWLDGRYPDSLDTPMVGSFENGVGTFYADDQFNGKPVRIRFLWTLPRSQNPRWEQAFSADSGASWETNWVMDFTRRA